MIVPALIDRTVAARNGRARLTNREFLYRSAFELGRHLIGYEVQKVLALIDALKAKRLIGGQKIAVFGYGEGGMIALYAAALDPRIEAVCVSGYFGDRNDVWRQPVDRNVFGLLEQFGDAEIASLIAPRSLIVEASKGPDVVIPPGTGGAPGRLTTPEPGERQGRGREGAPAGLGSEASRSDRAGRERPRRNRTIRDRRRTPQALARYESAPRQTRPRGSAPKSA